MGYSGTFRCNDCQTEFPASEGGGFLFHLLRCEFCDKTQSVGVDDWPSTISVRTDLAQLLKRYSTMEEIRRVRQTFVCPHCGGQLRDDLRPQCPHCRSRNTKLSPSHGDLWVCMYD